MTRLDVALNDAATVEDQLQAQEKQFQQNLIELFFLEIEILRAKKYSDSEQVLVKQFLSLPKNFSEILFYAKKCKETDEKDAEQDEDSDYSSIILSKKYTLAKAAELYLLEKDPGYQVIENLNQSDDSVKTKAQKVTEYFARLYAQEQQNANASDSANRPSSPGKR